MTWLAFKVKKLAERFNCPELEVWMLSDKSIDELFNLLLDEK
jgi:hypothetical protein